MKLVFADKAWENYLYRHGTDKKILKQINILINEIMKEPFERIGKPEPLKHTLSAHWFRRINDKHRIVYKVRDDSLLTAQLRYHY